MFDNIFLNIIVLFSPNYENKIVTGTVKKSISLLNQFITFYKSIKKNLNLIKYDISIVHYKDFNNEDLDKLNSLDVNIIKCNVDNFDQLCVERYIVKTKIKGTHRLLAETDMLLLKEPNFNWNVDFQKMYGGIANIFPISVMNKIYKMFDIKNRYIKNYNINQDLFISYNIKKKNKNNLFPHFNNGLTLITEEFSKKFYEKMISLDWINKQNKYFEPKYHHFLGQVLHSFVLLELTDNWEPFEPGINYLLKTYDVNKFGKENISLLHYCGIGAGKLVLNKFPEYFI